MVQQMFKTLQPGHGNKCPTHALFKSKEMPETLTRSKEMHKTLLLSKTTEIKGKLRNTFEIMGMISELISRMLIAPSVRMTDSPRHQTRHTRPTQSWKLVHDRKVWSPWRLHTTLSVFQLVRICNRVLGTNISERRHRYRINCLFFTKCHQAYTPYL